MEKTKFISTNPENAIIIDLKTLTVTQIMRFKCGTSTENNWRFSTYKQANDFAKTLVTPCEY